MTKSQIDYVYESQGNYRGMREKCMLSSWHVIIYRQNEPRPGQHQCHAPCLAFRHLPPNSARTGYASERALFISAQLSTDTQRPPECLGTNKTVIGNIASKHAREHEARPPKVKTQVSSVSTNHFGHERV